MHVLQGRSLARRRASGAVTHRFTYVSSCIPNPSAFLRHPNSLRMQNSSDHDGRTGSPRFVTAKLAIKLGLAQLPSSRGAPGTYGDGVSPSAVNQPARTPAGPLPTRAFSAFGRAGVTVRTARGRFSSLLPTPRSRRPARSRSGRGRVDAMMHACAASG
ncbi:hypothetical protein FKP32DRAFT_532201 [Trametes sanguinea]|nr:hypothetical protein FKP32DRAFT_532201 [Trametes sanguinea]